MDWSDHDIVDAFMAYRIKAFATHRIAEIKAMQMENMQLEKHKNQVNVNGIPEDNSIECTYSDVVMKTIADKKSIKEEQQKKPAKKHLP